MHEEPEADGKTPKAEIALLCFVLIISAGVWLWGFLHLPIWAAVLLWWWPSIFAGALAGAVVAGGYVLLTRVIEATKSASQVPLGRRSNRGPGAV
jgi:hypothetical protein